jgi:hypothetical protein
VTDTVTRPLPASIQLSERREIRYKLGALRVGLRR